MLTRSARLATAWADQVRANREQAERVREETPADFYGPVSRRFVVDPHRTDDPTLAALLELARPGETWFDIGCGAGRFALPLALRVGQVIALDPSPAMLAELREGMATAGIPNIRVIEGRWPFESGASLAATSADPIRADVVLMAHVGYDIEAIGAFLDAAEGAAHRLCVAVMAERAPATPAAVVWPAVHGEERHLLPALPEFEALLRARGTPPKVRIVERGARAFGSRDEAHHWLRHQCFIAADGAADGRLRDEIDRLATDPAGGLALPGEPVGVGVVTWTPRPA
jgi:SAM-dependent methyltransferase